MFNPFNSAAEQDAIIHHAIRKDWNNPIYLEAQKRYKIKKFIQFGTLAVGMLALRFAASMVVAIIEKED